LLSLQTLDPPEVTVLRRFLFDAKRAQDLETLETETVDFVDRTLDRLARAQTFDAITELAAPVALDTVRRLMGLPSNVADELASLSRRIFASTDYALDPDAARSGMEARMEAVDLVRKCLAHPTNGLLAQVAAMSPAVDVAWELVVNSVRAIFYGGFGSPLNFLGNAVLALLEHPGSLGLLRDEPRLIDSAVEELLRYEGPGQAESRICREETDLDGGAIAKGDILTVLIGAANHDPEQFPNPEELILGRHPNKHLAFGAGFHACYGSDIAVMEARVTISMLARRFPRTRLAGTPVRARHATVRRLESLPVCLVS
jgi:cytochrome P450